MESLMIFSETNIYILSKLVALIRRENGARHRLGSNDAIMALLKDASQSTDNRTQGYYFRFLEGLIPEQLAEFRDQGLSIPGEYMRKPGLLPSPVTRKYAHMPR